MFPPQLSMNKTLPNIEFSAPLVLGNDLLQIVAAHRRMHQCRSQAPLARTNYRGLSKDHPPIFEKWSAILARF